MKAFTFYWKNGKREVLKGADVVEALMNAGYTAASLNRLAFYTPEENHDFFWDESSNSWIQYSTNGTHHK
jgi:hypothetical protein